MSKYFRPKGKIRAFDEELYKKYDIPARKIIKEILKDFVEENPNKYGADMIIKSNKKCKYKYLELQVCTQWINEKFPHKYIYIWERKGRYNDDTLFFTLNRDMTMGYLFDISKINKEKPRRFRKYNRQFVYDIPWNQVMLVYCKYLTKELVEEF